MGLRPRRTNVICVKNLFVHGTKCHAWIYNIVSSSVATRRLSQTVQVREEKVFGYRSVPSVPCSKLQVTPDIGSMSVL
jgi:hypothetical protein